MSEEDRDRISSDVLLAHVAQITAAYVSKNKVVPEALPDLMSTISAGLRASILSREDKDTLRPEPAVPIEESLKDDVIICLEDGLPFQSLKRHLRVKYGLTPEEYREKWGLPMDYPMVAPDYAKRRSELAKRTGLGRHRA